MSARHQEDIEVCGRVEAGQQYQAIALGLANYSMAITDLIPFILKFSVPNHNT